MFKQDICVNVLDHSGLSWKELSWEIYFCVSNSLRISIFFWGGGFRVCECCSGSDPQSKHIKREHFNDLLTSF